MIQMTYELSTTEHIVVVGEWREWQQRWLVTIRYYGYSLSEPHLSEPRRHVEMFLSEHRPFDEIANANGRIYVVEHALETLTRLNA